MANEKNNPNDPTRIYYYNYWIYVFTGLWKYRSPKKWKVYLFRFYQFVLSFAYFVNVILFIVDAYAVRNDLEKFSFNMTSTALVLITFIKTSMMRFRRRLTESLLQDLNNNFDIEIDEDDKKILNEKAESILLITKLFLTILWIIYPLRVFAATALDSKSYLIPMPYPEKFEDYYALIYTHQVLMGSHFLMTVISHDMFIYGIIIRLVAHYEILENNVLKIRYLYPKTDFEKLVPGYKDCCKDEDNIRDVIIGKTNTATHVQIHSDKFKFGKARLVFSKTNNIEVREEKVFQMLTECIRHHQVLLKGFKSFIKIYGLPLLVQACGAVLLIGIVALHILFLSTELNFLLIQQVLYVGTTMMNILYLCTFGSDITIKSRAVASALYAIPWYEMNIKNRKTLHFTMKKFVKAPKMRGGNMVIINRVTYLKFLQLSYNMVAVLKNAF